MPPALHHRGPLLPIWNVPTSSSRSSPVVYLVGKTLKGLLYNVGAIDVRALLGVALVLLTSALIACYVPARRATKIDPLAALRRE